MKALLVTSLKRCLYGLFILGLLASLAVPSANAFWRHKKKERPLTPAERIRTYQPPPENAMTRDCDPIKQKVYHLTHVHWWQKPFVFIPKTRAVSRHQHCVNRVMAEEWEYLRHADIPNPPQLPKMTTSGMPSPDESHAVPDNPPSQSPPENKDVTPHGTEHQL